MVERMILQPGWLIDGSGSGPLRDHAVIVADGKILEVAPASGVESRASDRVVSLPGMTLLPGLINNHAHLMLPGDNTPFVPWIDLQSDATLALWAAHNALVSLNAGVTTIRDCGGRGRIILDLRDLQRTGQAGGARVISGGWTITITGGHTRHFGGEVDGVDAAVQMTRRIVSQGADFVKVMASGGGTPGSLSQYPSFTREELRAIVDTAHGLGRPVCAHCIASDSLANAIEAGVDFIEHASFMAPDSSTQYDPALAERLAESGIPVTPTLAVARDMVDCSPAGPERELWERRLEAQRRTVGHLHELGVPLLAGSDAGWRATAFDAFWKEIDELATSGLSNVEAIGAATSGVSQALGRGDEIGRVAAGLAADLLVVEGNLTDDLKHLRDVRLVFQGGELVDRYAGAFERALAETRKDR